MDSTDDFLGRAVIRLDEASTNFNMKLTESELQGLDAKEIEEKKMNSIPTPKWHDIRIGFDEKTPATGKVLCSFVVAPDDFDFETPVRYVNLQDIITTLNYNI